MPDPNQINDTSKSGEAFEPRKVAAPTDLNIDALLTPIKSIPFLNDLNGSLGILSRFGIQCVGDLVTTPIERFKQGSNPGMMTNPTPTEEWFREADAALEKISMCFEMAIPGGLLIEFYRARDQSISGRN